MGEVVYILKYLIVASLAWGDIVPSKRQIFKKKRLINEEINLYGPTRLDTYIEPSTLESEGNQI